VSISDEFVASEASRARVAEFDRQVRIIRHEHELEASLPAKPSHRRRIAGAAFVLALVASVGFLVLMPNGSIAAPDLNVETGNHPSGPVIAK
jgi:hypothetical protein